MNAAKKSSKTVSGYKMFFGLGALFLAIGLFADFIIYLFSDMGFLPIGVSLVAATLLLVAFFWFFGLVEDKWVVQWKYDETAFAQDKVADFQEKEAYEAGFTSYFEKEVKPQVILLEKGRFVSRRRAYFRWLVSAVTLLLTALAAFFIGVDPLGEEAVWWFIFGVLGFELLCFFIWVRMPGNDYKKAMKSGFLPVIARFYGELDYEASTKLDLKFFKGLAVLKKTVSRGRQWDTIFGTYKKMKLQVSNLVLVRHADPNNQESAATTVFKGTMIRIQFPKAFMGRTVVEKDSFIKNPLRALFNKHGLETVNLEDPRFEKEYEVYSTDQQEARFLLTTVFMEKLTALSEAYYARGREPMHVEFYEKSLVILLPTKQALFQAGSLSKTVLDHDDLHVFLRQMHEIFSLIDVLAPR